MQYSLPPSFDWKLPEGRGCGLSPFLPLDLPLVLNTELRSLGWSICWLRQHSRVKLQTRLPVILKEEDSRAFYLSHADFSLNATQKFTSFSIHLFLRHCCLKNCHQITVTTPSCPFGPAAILNCLCLQTELSVLQKEDRCSKNPWSLPGSCLLSEEKESSSLGFPAEFSRWSSRSVSETWNQKGRWGC